MRKWPLNSITLFSTTHSKLRMAVDGTGTQVTTCMINKWTAKINEKEIYNTRGLPRMGQEKKEEERDRKEEGRSSYHPRKLLQLSTKEPRRRRINPRTKPEDKLPPFPYTFDHSISVWSCLDIKLSLKPSSWVHFLYQTYCIGPVRFGLIRLTVKSLQKRTLQLAPSVGRTCVLVRTTIEHGRIRPP